MDFFNRHKYYFLLVAAFIMVILSIGIAYADRRNREISFRYAGSLGSCKIYSSYDDKHVLYLTTGGCSIAVQ